MSLGVKWQPINHPAQFWFIILQNICGSKQLMNLWPHLTINLIERFVFALFFTWFIIYTDCYSNIIQSDAFSLRLSATFFIHLKIPPSPSKKGKHMSKAFLFCLWYRFLVLNRLQDTFPTEKKVRYFYTWKELCILNSQHHVIALESQNRNSMEGSPPFKSM